MLGLDDFMSDFCRLVPAFHVEALHDNRHRSRLSYETVAERPVSAMASGFAQRFLSHATREDALTTANRFTNWAGRRSGVYVYHDRRIVCCPRPVNRYGRFESLLRHFNITLWLTIEQRPRLIDAYLPRYKLLQENADDQQRQRWIGGHAGDVGRFFRLLV